MDDDGYVVICGRLKDMIICGGENVYPVEIEQFLHQHPKIADVQVTCDSRPNHTPTQWRTQNYTMDGG